MTKKQLIKSLEELIEEKRKESFPSEYPYSELESRFADGQAFQRDELVDELRRLIAEA